MATVVISSLISLLSVLCCAALGHVLPDISVNDSYSVFDSSNLFPRLPIVVVGSSDEQCRKDSRVLLDNLRNLTTWAMQMVDASAKGAEGFLIGSIYQMGNFEECVKTVFPIQAQYCLAELTIQPPHPLPSNDDATVFYNPLGSVWNKIWHEGDKERVSRNKIFHAVCVPASCSHTDVQTSLDRHLAASSGNLTITVQVLPSLCQTNRMDEKLSPGSLVYCVVIATILLAVLVSTICDTNTYSAEKQEQASAHKNGNTIDYATAFSLKRNWYGLCRISKNSYGCINGLKLLTTLVVIFSHRSFLQLGSPFYNYEIFEKNKLKFSFGISKQLETVVDSFFVMSGMLVTSGLLNVMERKLGNPVMAIVSKYLRFVPVYSVIVFFYATVMFHMGGGPLWTAIIGRERDFCQENWWTNLLFINNYVNDGRMCMIHSWYMAPEFQLFVLATLLVVLIHKCPKLGYATLGLAMIASLIAPFATTLIEHIAPVQFFNADLFALERVQPYFQRMYTKTHIHATPYLVGIVGGLILHSKRAHQTRYTWQSWVGVTVGCLLSLGSLLPGAFISSHIWQYNSIEGALVQTQRRFFWPMGVAVVVLSLIFSKDSILDKILSCRVVEALSKLCYSAYLASLCIQLQQVAIRVAPSPLAVLPEISDTLSDIAITYFVAFLLYLTVEAPFSKLLVLLLRRQRQEPRSKA